MRQILILVPPPDVVSRGLDFPSVEHIISFDPPYAAEDVVHRAGRTARCTDVARARRQQAFCQPIFCRLLFTNPFSGGLPRLEHPAAVAAAE
jgi:hypothetical protein